MDAEIKKLELTTTLGSDDDTQIKYSSHQLSKNKNGRKNKPRFLDYRRSPLPLDVALSFLLVENGNCPNDKDAARQLILSKNVLVNNVIESSCQRLVCRHTDRIAVCDVDLKRPIPMPRYFVCYKPRGVICSNKRNEGVDRDDAIYISNWLDEAFMRSRLFDVKEKTINTVGRLDEDSEGLLLLTNDGSFSRLLCDPEFGLTKTYRVVAKGSGFGNLKSLQNDSSVVKRITEMIERGNPKFSMDGSLIQPHISYESCKILDVGRLPSQHAADDSYYVLLDLTLREGKTHAVRRIIKNSGLRVCYLSRIKVEGLDEFAVVSPGLISEADADGFLLIMKCKAAFNGGMLINVCANDPSLVLKPGNIVELNTSHVDKIFSLRS